MPRRRAKKKRSGGISSNGDMDGIRRFAGRYLLQDTAVHSINRVVISPCSAVGGSFLNDIRVVAIAQFYQFYRFLRVRARLYPTIADSAAAASAQLSFELATGGTAPTVANQVQSALYAVGDGQYGNPFPRLNIGQKEFRNGQLKWYATSGAGASDETPGTPGSLSYSWADSATFDGRPITLFVEFDLEFKGFIATADLVGKCMQVIAATAPHDDDSEEKKSGESSPTRKPTSAGRKHVSVPTGLLVDGVGQESRRAGSPTSAVALIAEHRECVSPEPATGLRVGTVSQPDNGDDFVVVGGVVYEKVKKMDPFG